MSEYLKNFLATSCFFSGGVQHVGYVDSVTLDPNCGTQSLPLPLCYSLGHGRRCLANTDQRLVPLFQG